MACRRRDHAELIGRCVGEAKATLSQLLVAALAGEEVVVAPVGKPLVRLVPIGVPTRRDLGCLPLEIPDALFAPLSQQEQAGWQ